MVNDGDGEKAGCLRYICLPVLILALSKGQGGCQLEWEVGSALGSR